MLKKVVIIGPESTGKSTLCQQLATYYKTMWVPEYAREYLMTKGRDYTYDDLLDIAKGQLLLEDSIAEKAKGQPAIFIDTDMYVMKVWSEFVFGKCHSFILDAIATRKYDLYLLCKTDLPWVKDELRELPDLATREKLYLTYKDILTNQQTPWGEISGDNNERLAKGIVTVNKIL